MRASEAGRLVLEASQVLPIGDAGCRAVALSSVFTFVCKIHLYVSVRFGTSIHLS